MTGNTAQPVRSTAPATRNARRGCAATSADIGSPFTNEHEPDSGRACTVPIPCKQRAPLITPRQGRLRLAVGDRAATRGRHEAHVFGQHTARVARRWLLPRRAPTRDLL